MTTPTSSPSFDHPGGDSAGDTDDGRMARSIDLLDESAISVNGVVVRNQKLPTRSGVLAAALLLGGFTWLVSPAFDTLEETGPALDARTERTTVVSIGEHQNHDAGSEPSSPSALATGAGFQSLVDRAVNDAFHGPPTTNKTSFDQAFPLGAPHE